ncbi:hypothetical protein EDD22DRAFT_904166, partial [Suillus occidentalis]
VHCVLAAALVTGVEVARQERINNRHLNKLYLCRSQLLSNPREITPWQVLYERKNLPVACSSFDNTL